MPIISTIGQKDKRVRALNALIYGLLLLGGITMVYPFLIMLSGSTKSAVDIKDHDLIPAFTRSDTILYRKYLEGLFNESLDLMNITYNTAYASFEDVEPPSEIDENEVADWDQFIKSLKDPSYYYGTGFMRAEYSRTIPSGLRGFKKQLADQFGKDIESVNSAIGTDYPGWNEFYVIPESYYSRRNMPPSPRFRDPLWSFKKEQPQGYRYYFVPDNFFRSLYLKNKYGNRIEELNERHNCNYANFQSIPLPPTNAGLKSEWVTFVREVLSILWIRVDKSADPEFRQFLLAKYGSLEAFNRNYGTEFKEAAAITLPFTPPLTGIMLTDLSAFISGWKDDETGRLHQAPGDSLRVISIEQIYRSYSQSKEDINPPQQAWHYQWFQQHRSELRNEFLTRNYRTVFDYMFFHGRGLVNTIIYCFLAVFFALLVNPLAAYAMSRYKMPTTYKILLFLMLTMAFPPMVTQIPSFLMLRKLHLLNTFAALILPGLAYGYAIFLLKGFFDSLPRDLYESAQIDGASEWTMFWQITMSLSKPILAVIALQAFTMAYSNFMYALLICQDEKMWTLMVWLYQLQQYSGPAVIYASLIIAAIPTFFIFLFCQNIIIRGIVIPVEK